MEEFCKDSRSCKARSIAGQRCVSCSPDVKVFAQPAVGVVSRSFLEKIGRSLWSLLGSAQPGNKPGGLVYWGTHGKVACRVFVSYSPFLVISISRQLNLLSEVTAGNSIQLCRISSAPSASGLQSWSMTMRRVMCCARNAASC